jgi:hypothetical protein
VDEIVSHAGTLLKRPVVYVQADDFACYVPVLVDRNMAQCNFPYVDRPETILHGQSHGYV